MRFCLNYLQFWVSNLCICEEIMSTAPDIDADYLLWIERQVDLIRERQFAQLDIANLLEELDYLVKKHKRSLRSRVRVLMLHLLKCEYQPFMRSSSWVSTICTQRSEIEDLLEDSPSLKRLLGGFVDAEYKRAVKQAMFETGLPRTSFPASPPYTEQQLLDVDFIP
jgi:hypothetical protein